MITGEVPPFQEKPYIVGTILVFHIRMRGLSGHCRLVSQVSKYLQQVSVVFNARNVVPGCL